MVNQFFQMVCFNIFLTSVVKRESVETFLMEIHNSFKFNTERCIHEFILNLYTSLR
jgi:hypothetical protein